MYEVNSPNDILIANTSDTAYTVSCLQSDSTYKFFVIALNSANAKSDESNTVTVAMPTIPNPDITGPSIICSSGSFTLNNCPPNSTVSWTNSNNLIYVSGQGTDNYSVENMGGKQNGTGWVKAIINSSCSVDTIEKNIWVGKPSAPTDIGFFPNEPCLNQIVLAAVQANNPAISGADYVWRNIDGYTCLSPTCSQVSFTTLPTLHYTTYVYVKATNICGSSMEYSELLSVKDCGGGVPASPAFVISPNPASSEITISPNQNLMLISGTAQTNDSIQSKITMIKSVKIMNNYGTVYLRRKFAKDTKTANINISGLKKGIYILIINGETKPESHNFIKN